MFIDEIRITARAGHGGRGCVAFLREARKPKGGPAGGDGGRGGDVILEADHDLNNLIAQYYQPRLVAPSGGHGLGKGMDGRSGADLVVKVPCGTLVWGLPTPRTPAAVSEFNQSEESERRPLPMSLTDRPLLPYASSEPNSAAPSDASTAPPQPLPAHQRGELVADLTQHGQRFVLCRGGRGGLGNRHFATARRQAPRFAQPGEPGEQGAYLLELRLIADAGLVGYPNAGKSTLLAALSNAHPKIAPYPFTTLHPQVGIVEYANWERLSVCDVPGLIEGAHRNVGLGHAFLRHVARCRALVLLLDMAGSDGRRPWEDYEQLLKELELYDSALLDKPRLLVANKMDEPVAAANLRAFRRRVPKTSVISLAAAFGTGLDRFKRELRRIVGEK